MEIGVIIPAFNAERYLARTLESTLAQTLRPHRVVVVDDGSSDGTARVAERFSGPVTCFRRPNRGVSAARNYGAREAGTEWLAFLDADDVWLPSKLERQREALANGQTAACFTALRLVDDRATLIRDVGTIGMQSDLEALLFHRESIPQGTSSTMLVRRDVFDSIGGYDESLSTVADWDLLIRLRLQTLFCYVSEALVLYRRHGSSMSRNVQLLAEESGRVLDKAFKAPELPSEMRGLRGHCLAWNDLVLSGCYFWGGRPGRAMHFAARAVWGDPRLIGRILGFPGRQVRRLWNREPRPGIV